MHIGLLVGSVELGGTKAIVGIARDPLSPLDHRRIETRDPHTTLSNIEGFFREAADRLGPLSALGVASFGPIDIRRDSPSWGRIGATTKLGWAGADIAGRLGEKLGCRVELDTDVNGAALAEWRWGAGRGLRSFVYLTVGTGIGGGLVIDGRPVHGALHPEMGHIRLRRDPDDAYPGCCRYHGDCAEGLASGPAIVARFGVTLDALAPNHPFRATLADYLGQLCATLVLVASPERIVIGGGVMAAAGLHDQVREAMGSWLGGYLTTAHDESFIVPPTLGDGAGLAGGFALAQHLLEQAAEDPDGRHKA